MNITETLLNTFLFDSFNENQIHVLQSSLSVKKVSKDEQIFLEGQNASAFFIIISGRVKIYKISPNGDERTLHIHGKGEIIAEAAMFDLKTYPAHCQALEDTELIRISRDRLIELLQHNPDFALKMLASYSRRLREFVHIIEDLSFRNIRSRLAKHLINNQSIEANGIYCTIDLSKKELASLLGTIPETLSRAFDFLKKKNLIEEKNKRILILDFEKLKLLAEI